MRYLVIFLLLLGTCTREKPNVCVKETLWQASPDGTYVGELRLYSDSLQTISDFVQPYDFGIRESHFYITIKREKLIDYYRKKETIIELLNFNYTIECINTN